MTSRSEPEPMPPASVVKLLQRHTVMVDQGDYEAFQRLAVETGSMSASAVIRKAMAEYLERHAQCSAG